MTQIDTARLEEAARAFRQMAERCVSEHAPLYEELSKHIADDSELLSMAALARPTQSMPYLLYDAVHYLMLSGAQHPLSRYYPTLTEEPLTPDGAYPAFRDFCLQHEAEIREIIPTHDNQTNEVGRMAALLPVISEAARRGGDKPLGLVEVGPSAGLNLCFDRYYFDYGRVRWGDSASSVRFPCALEDEKTPPLVPGRPNIGYRIGLDLEPIDVTDEAAARWLVSSTWPDHRDLSHLQRQAIEVLRRDPPTILQGDALTVGAVLDEVPEDLTLCVYQSMMLNHLTPEGRARFMAILAAKGAERDLYFVSMVGAGQGNLSRRARVEMHAWVDGSYQTDQLVECHSHGRTVRWLGD